MLKKRRYLEIKVNKESEACAEDWLGTATAL
jgi:hypothetical protein